jgi:hypothetical protein
MQPNNSNERAKVAFADDQVIQTVSSVIRDKTDNVTMVTGLGVLLYFQFLLSLGHNKG